MKKQLLTVALLLATNAALQAEDGGVAQTRKPSKDVSYTAGKAIVSGEPARVSTETTVIEPIDNSPYAVAPRNFEFERAQHEELLNYLEVINNNINRIGEKLRVPMLMNRAQVY